MFRYIQDFTVTNDDIKEKFKKEKKRSSANSSFVVAPKNKVHFHSFKTTPTLRNRLSQCSRENTAALSLFKKQFLEETALNSPSVKESLKRIVEFIVTLSGNREK